MLQVLRPVSHFQRGSAERVICKGPPGFGFNKLGIFREDHPEDILIIAELSLVYMRWTNRALYHTCYWMNRLVFWSDLTTTRPLNNLLLNSAWLDKLLSNSLLLNNLSDSFLSTRPSITSIQSAFSQFKSIQARHQPLDTSQQFIPLYSHNLLLGEVILIDKI
jgi:hypothetical protein